MHKKDTKVYDNIVFSIVILFITFLFSLYYCTSLCPSVPAELCLSESTSLGPVSNFPGSVLVDHSLKVLPWS
jgi:hypothetical protein